MLLEEFYLRFYILETEVTIKWCINYNVKNAGR